MNDKELNVLSLFDGMSCGRIAITELGIPIGKYYASEIDKHAIKQTQLNFPDTIQLGSVTDVDVSKLDKIDLLLGGSPCQSFSFAGKRNGMTTTEKQEIYTLEKYLELKENGFQFEGQSYLFWEYMRILTDIRKYNPDVLFLLENVEMGKKWERVLSEAIGVYGVHINSALVSAQNRRRIYWTNIRTRQEGLFGDVYSDIPQPKDRGVFLRDILEDEVDEKYYIKSKSMLNFIQDKWRLKKKYTQINGEKSLPLMARGTDVTWCGDYIIQRPRGNNKGNTFEGKSPTMSANSWEQNNLLCERQRKNYKLQDEKANSFLSTSHKGSQANGMTLVKNSNDPDCDRIRRLTPTECARLQTIRSWYKWECSDTQQYRMLGNGWNIETIKHILSFIKTNNKNEN